MSFQDDTYQISTPENVDFGYEIAGIGSRFLAALLDTFLISVLQVAVLLTVILVARLAGAYSGALDMTAAWSGWAAALLGLLAFGFFWGYYIFFESLWAGQTPGKRSAGLRVIRADGAPIGFVEAAIRNLVRLIDFLPAYYGVGVVTMFIDGRSRRLGDLAAGTLVVRDRGALLLQDIERETASLAHLLRSAPPGEALPVAALPPADLRLAEDFLRRRYDLANRDQLAAQIAARLRRQLDLPPNPAAGEAFIVQVVKQARAI